MATTINSYSVGLNLDASSYIRNSNLSRQETVALKRDIASARTPAERYAQTVDRLDKAVLAGAIDQRVYNRLIDEAKRKHNAADIAASKSANTMEQLKGRVLGVAAAYVSVGAAVRTAKWAVSLAAQAEDAEVSFEVMTKSAEKAKRLMGDLRSFSAATPFKQTEVIEAGKKLLAFGVAADNVQARLQMMGNIAAATGTRISELAEIIGKMRVQGRIMSEDINQLSGRGINVIDGLADRLKVLPGEVKQAAAQGKISFEDLLAVLQRLSDEDYGGMLEKRAATLNGRWSTLNDTIEETGRIIGDWPMPKEGSFFDPNGWVKSFNDGLFVLQGGLKDTAKLQAEADAEAIRSAELLERLKAGKGMPQELIDQTKQAARERRIADREAAVAQRRERERLATEKFVAAESTRLNAEQAAERQQMAGMQKQVADNVLRMADMDYGDIAGKQIRLAFESVNELRKGIMLTRIQEGESLDSILGLVNEELTVEARLKREMIDRIGKQERLIESKQREKQLGDAIMQKQQQIAQVEKQMAAQREQERQKMRQDIAAGPGSGLEDPMAAIAQQINSRLANQVKLPTDDELERQRVKAGDNGNQHGKEQVSELQQLRSELAGLKAQQRQESADLVAAIKGNGFQRIR